MVARHGKLVKFRRYGYQALGAGEPLREDAIFRIASMTKPIIAVAMLLLYEEGKWQLDDPVTKFIPRVRRFAGVAGWQACAARPSDDHAPYHGVLRGLRLRSCDGKHQPQGG